MNAYLTKIKLTSSAVALSWSLPTFTIERDGGLLTGNGTATASTDWTWNELNGETVFQIYASNIEIKDTSNKTASLTIKIDDVTTDVEFGNVKRLLPTWATKSITAKVSE
jgi:hypothetical protein